MTTFEDALLLAAQAHAGQLDKAGAPYILHPLRIMFRMATEVGRVAALLHDVVEDSAFTLEDLRRKGFSEEVIEAVDALTRRPQESYEAFVDRVAQHPLAARIKLLDLEDNMDLSRLNDVTERDMERMRKYHTAWRRLKGLLRVNGGDGS